MNSRVSHLDSVENENEVLRILKKKPFLQKFYLEVYDFFKLALERCPRTGLVVELGSGKGFIKERIPETITTDVLAYEGIDQIVDARKMPFKDESVRAFLLFDVFHHIPDVEAFFKEASRCLVPGGRILMVDQYLGWISRPVLKYLHHEPFHPQATEWAFPEGGPLSSANGALAWMVFERDREKFQKLFPTLQVARYQPHSPLRYWLSGGLKSWSLAPGFLFPLWTALDQILVKLTPRLASFVNIEVVKRGQ